MLYLAAQHLSRGDDAAPHRPPRGARRAHRACRWSRPTTCIYHDARAAPAAGCADLHPRSICTIDEAGYRLFANAERHLKVAGRDGAALRGHGREAVARTLEIAERCRFSLDELRYEYPDELTGEGRTPQQELDASDAAGAADALSAAACRTRSRPQLDHELALIEELDYAPYFLTVHDIVALRPRARASSARGAARPPIRPSAIASASPRSIPPQHRPAVRALRHRRAQRAARHRRRFRARAARGGDPVHLRANTAATAPGSPPR